MAYFRDLSPYRYCGKRQAGVVHIGWLDGRHKFSKGEVSTEIVASLRQLASSPVELYRGLHVCELCTPPEGISITDHEPYWAWAQSRASNGEIRAEHEGITYAAPVIITHYIEEHGYCPPEQFLRAVTECRTKPCTTTKYPRLARLFRG